MNKLKSDDELLDLVDGHDQVMLAANNFYDVVRIWLMYRYG